MRTTFGLTTVCSAQNDFSTFRLAQTISKAATVYARGARDDGTGFGGQPLQASPRRTIFR